MEFNDIKAYMIIQLLYILSYLTDSCSLRKRPLKFIYMYVQALQISKLQ